MMEILTAAIALCIFAQTFVIVDLLREISDALKERNDQSC